MRPTRTILVTSSNDRTPPCHGGRREFESLRDRQSWGRLLTVRKCDFHSHNASSTLVGPTIYANENADRNRIRSQGSNQDVLVDNFDIPVVDTKFVSLCGGVERHAKPYRDIHPPRDKIR